ncbi:ATP-dependent DNA ligase [Streptomyces roseoverticillatus]
MVLEISADTARDSAGRWRHPVRTDLGTGEVPRIGEPDRDAPSP